MDADIYIRMNHHKTGGSLAQRDSRSVIIQMAKGITLSGCGGSAPDDDPFEKDCWWSGYDGRCDTCGGAGEVRKRIPGTNEHIRQECENCSMGICKHCGGDGSAPGSFGKAVCLMKRYPLQPLRQSTALPSMGGNGSLKHTTKASAHARAEALVVCIIAFAGIRPCTVCRHRPPSAPRPPRSTGPPR